MPQLKPIRKRQAMLQPKTLNTNNKNTELDIVSALNKMEKNIMSKLDTIQEELDNLKVNGAKKEKIPSIEQQIEAVDKLSNLLSKEEKEVFAKAMDDIERRKLH